MTRKKTGGKLEIKKRSLRKLNDGEMSAAAGGTNVVLRPIANPPVLVVAPILQNGAFGADPSNVQSGAGSPHVGGFSHPGGPTHDTGSAIGGGGG